MKKNLLLIFITISSIAFSQDAGTTRIQVFKPADGSPKDVTPKDSASMADHNVIKWNYFLLGRGVFLINWEFRVTGNLTAELGLGLTYRDFVFEFSKYQLFGTQNSSGVDATSPWADCTPKVNPCGEAGLRYYLTGFDDFEGFYISGALSYRPYTFTAAPITDPNTIQVGSITPSYSFLDFQFKVGYQIQSRSSSFTYDSYIGVGYRSADMKYYNSVLETNGMIENVATSGNQSFPQFLFGAKIGYTF